MLSVENLNVVYDEVIHAVKGVSLDLPEGGVVAVLGPNGSGKTSLLRAVAGILKSREGKVTAGTVRLQGVPIEGWLPERIARQSVMLIPEGGGLFIDLTVQEHLRLAASLAPRRGARDGVSAADRVWEWFPRLRDRVTTRAGYLSGGEQQMLSLAQALLRAPRLLLLDEPSLGLSPALVEELFRTVERLNREEGMSVLLVEQNAAMALGVATHAYILENGKIVLEGTSKALLEDREVRQYYLGTGGHGGRASYRDAKHYKTRKRWLS